ncbi:MAG: ribosome maturation factor RimM [Pseudomonadota bacterium]
MTQTARPLVTVGILSGAHGVRGDVRVKSFTDDPDAIFDYGPLLDETGDVLLEAKSVRVAKDHFIVSPKQRRQKEEWDALKGVRLHVWRDSLPETGDDEFYIDDLVGMAVLGPTQARIGIVKAVLDHGAGDLLEILPQNGGASVFVPFTQNDVPEVSVAERRITVVTFDLWADQSGDQTGASSKSR